MNIKELLEGAYLLQAGLGLAVLLILQLRKAFNIFPQLRMLLVIETVSMSLQIAFLFHRHNLHITKEQDYLALFLTNWITGGLALAMRILIVYGVFSEAMRPLSGLHAVGKIIFRWVGVVSGLVALALVAGPGVFTSRDALIEVFGRLQQGVSVLTICLLVFVCFTVRPLGLTFRSHLFGVSLGLGIAATVELVQAAWFVTIGARSVYSPVYLLSSLGFCVSIAVWGVYFALPEPRREMILLPTTSPFFFWNRISEILGDAPGQVAVAGFTPEMLAPAEIEMLTSATAEDATADGPQTEATFRPQGRSLPEFGAMRRPSVAL